MDDRVNFDLGMTYLASQTMAGSGAVSCGWMEKRALACGCVMSEPGGTCMWTVVISMTMTMTDDRCWGESMAACAWLGLPLDWCFRRRLTQFVGKFFKSMFG